MFREFLILYQANVPTLTPFSKEDKILNVKVTTVGSL